MAPEWTSVPPAPGDFAAVRLHRVPTAGSITGIITSTQIYGCWTHWDSYRTQPCPGPDCKLCKDGNPGRWHCWISIYSQMYGRQAVVQLTALAAQSLLQQCERYPSMRGVLVNFSRSAKRPNARIIVETRQLSQPIDALPAEIDIPKYMGLIWQASKHLDNKVPHQFRRLPK